MISSPLVVTDDPPRGATIHNGSQEILMCVVNDAVDDYTALHWATSKHPGPSNSLFSAGSPALRTSGVFTAVRGADQPAHYEAEPWERAPTALQDQAAATSKLLQFVRAYERMPSDDEFTEEMREEIGSMCAAGVLHRMITFMSTTTRMASRRVVPRLAHLYDAYIEARQAIQVAYASAGRPTAREFLALPNVKALRVALVTAMNGVCLRLVMAHDAAISLISTLVVQAAGDEKDEARLARGQWNRQWATSAEFKPVLGRLLEHSTLGVRNVCISDDKFHAMPIAEALSGNESAQRALLRRAGLDPDHSMDSVYVRSSGLERGIAQCNTDRSYLSLMAAFPGLHVNADGSHSALADARLASLSPEARPTEELALQRFMWASAIEMGMAEAGENASIADEIFAALDSLALYRWSHDGASPPVAQSFADISQNSTAMAAVVSRHRPTERQGGVRAVVDLAETAVVNMALAIFSNVVADEGMWARSGLTLRPSHYLKAVAPSLESQAAALVMTPPLQEDPSVQLWTARTRADKQARGDTDSRRGPLSSAEAAAVDAEVAPGDGATTMVTLAHRRGFNYVPGPFPADGDIEDNSEMYEARVFWRMAKPLRSNLFWSPPTPETAPITGFFSDTEWKRTLRGSRAERWGAWNAALCIATREGMRAGDISAPPVMDLQSLQQFYQGARVNTALYVLSEVLDDLSMHGMPLSRAYFTRRVARRRAAAGELGDDDDGAVGHVNQPGAPRAVMQVGRDALDIMRTAAERTEEATLRALDDFQNASAAYAALLEGVRFSPNDASVLRISVPSPVPALYRYTTPEASADAFEGIMTTQAALARAEAYLAAVLTRADGFTPDVLALATERLATAGNLTRQAVGNIMLESSLGSDGAALRSTIRRFRPSLG